MIIDNRKKGFAATHKQFQEASAANGKDWGHWWHLAHTLTPEKAGGWRVEGTQHRQIF